MEYSTKLVSNPVDYICVYTRVSTRKQSTDKKHGLSYQKELCKNYIDKFYSSTINESYWEDVGSSYKSKLILREMGEIIRKLKPNTMVVISEVSRLGRNYKMVENVLKAIQKKKSYVVSISENLVYGMTKLQNKQFIHKVIDSEKESDVLSMRTKNTQSYIKKNGGYIGKPPFGYKITKNSRNIPVLKQNPEDFYMIDNIVNLTNDCYSYDEIANIMNTKNLFYKNKMWSGAKIKEILKKFYPEHMFLDVIQSTESKINVIDENMECILDDDIPIDNDEIINVTNYEPTNNNTLLDTLTITINNNNKKRSVTLNTNKINETNDTIDTNNKRQKTGVDKLMSLKKEESCIKLRSGKIILKF